MYISELASTASDTNRQLNLIYSVFIFNKFLLDFNILFVIQIKLKDLYAKLEYKIQNKKIIKHPLTILNTNFLRQKISNIFISDTNKKHSIILLACQIIHFNWLK